MKQHSMGRAPDYTTAALVSIGVNLFCLLIGIWALWGIAPVLLTGLALNTLINRVERRRRG